MANTHVWFREGASLLDLQKSLFGTQVQKEDPHFPKLTVVVSKAALKFGWLQLAKDVKLGIYSVTRVSATEWLIKASISDSQTNDDIFGFEGTYSTQSRIGAGSIVANWFDTRTDYYSLMEVEAVYTKLVKSDGGKDVRDIFRVAHMLWDRSRLAEPETGSEQLTISTLKGLSAMTSDYRVQYLVQMLLEKLK